MLLIPSCLKNDLICDLEKFIIMEDVIIESLENRPWGLISCNVEDYSKHYFEFEYNGEDCFCCWGTDICSTLGPVNDRDLHILSTLSGRPILGKNIFKGQLINETILNKLAVDYTKGCFLGQETVSKVNTGRDIIKTLMLIISTDLESIKDGNLYVEEGGKKVKAGQVFSSVRLENKLYIQAELKRPYRVLGRTYHFQLEEGGGFEGVVRNIPLWEHSEKVEKLYEWGGDLFQRDHIDKALQVLKKVIEMNPNFIDAYESIGVMFGHSGEYQKAIHYMDQLLVLNPDSIMAHTNKSLYLMKLGKIDEAEEEKALATVASFKSFGKKAENQEKVEGQSINKELLKKEEMFNQVLEIDQDDLVANYGLADILYQKKEYSGSLDFIEKVLSLNPKYSVAYLLKGNILFDFNQIKRAKKTYEEGILVAVKNGDLSPANKMQSKLKLFDLNQFNNKDF